MGVKFSRSWQRNDMLPECVDLARDIEGREMKKIWSVRVSRCFNGLVTGQGHNYISSLFFSTRRKFTGSNIMSSRNERTMHCNVDQNQRENAVVRSLSNLWTPSSLDFERLPCYYSLISTCQLVFFFPWKTLCVSMPGKESIPPFWCIWMSSSVSLTCVGFLIGTKWNCDVKVALWHQQDKTGRFSAHSTEMNI